MKQQQEARDDVSLDSFDEMLSANQATEWTTESETCAVCYAVEGVMTNLFTLPYFESYMESIDGEEADSSDKNSRPLTPKRVCRLWKKKRRAEKVKLRELRGQDVGVLTDANLICETKRNAQRIQRSFEKSFDEGNYSQRYERYGSRANFVSDRRV